MMRIRRAVLAAALPAVLGTAVGTALTVTPASAAPNGQDIGTSREGRAIRAHVLGDPDADVRVVVLGSMHGDEPAGTRVVSALLQQAPPPGTAIWLVSTMNPDGLARGTRTNAHAVDLNRNFPASWRPQDAGTAEWSGPRAASEPETRAVMDFLVDVRPTAVLSFHQPFDVVDITHSPARKAGRLLARWMDVQARSVGCGGPCRGTLTEWATDELDTIAMTVELPAVATRADVDSAASAALRLTQWLGAGAKRT